MNIFKHYFKIFSVTALIVILTAVYLFPLSAFALNSDYLEPEKWAETENAVTVPLNYEKNGNTLSGYFSYYTDDSLCIYTFFKISESSVTAENNNVSVTYDFSMSDEEYTVTLNKNGVAEDNAPEGLESFRSGVNFDTNGQYASAVQYIGKKYDFCTVDITLNVNGHNYKITKNSGLFGSPVYMELPTTVKEEKSAAVVKDKKKSKKAKKGKKKSRKNKKKAEATTKFQPKYNITVKADTTTAKSSERKTKSTAAPEASPSENNAATQSGAYYEKLTVGAKREMSRPAKLMGLFGLLLVIIGIAVVIANALLKRQYEKEEEKKDEKTEDKKEE
ncbi:MAG: hypothetical protein K6C14_00360 [Eubacterium sp.]|nr:hypothetical protein [Eubacterium sp.]